jgi:transcriptional regulator with XRE-family HTH domain
MRRPSPTRRRRAEADKFRFALMALREAQGWTQQRLGIELSVSKRTLSNWECGYWLPPFKQRLHLVLALRDMPPEHVLDIADGLGVSIDPAVAPFLQPYRDALEEPEEAPVAAPPPPVPPPPPPRPSPEELRAAVDAVVRDAADGMNVSANELRAALGRALDACGAMNATLEDARGAVVVKEKKGGRGAASGE